MPWKSQAPESSRIVLAHSNTLRPSLCSERSLSSSKHTPPFAYSRQSMSSARTNRRSVGGRRRKRKACFLLEASHAQRVCLNCRLQEASVYNRHGLTFRHRSFPTVQCAMLKSIIVSTRVSQEAHSRLKASRKETRTDPRGTTALIHHSSPRSCLCFASAAMFCIHLNLNTAPDIKIPPPSSPSTARKFARLNPSQRTLRSKRRTHPHSAPLFHFRQVLAPVAEVTTLVHKKSSTPLRSQTSLPLPSQPNKLAAMEW